MNINDFKFVKNNKDPKSFSFLLVNENIQYSIFTQDNGETFYVSIENRTNKNCKWKTIEIKKYKSIKACLLYLDEYIKQK